MMIVWAKVAIEGSNPQSSYSAFVGLCRGDEAGFTHDEEETSVCQFFDTAYTKKQRY